MQEVQPVTQSLGAARRRQRRSPADADPAADRRTLRDEGRKAATSSSGEFEEQPIGDGVAGGGARETAICSGRLEGQRAPRERSHSRGRAKSSDMLSVRRTQVDLTFDQQTVQRVWEKGQVTENADPEIWRQDQCGAWIRRDSYGDLESQFGWEIDRVIPGHEDGEDEFSNLRPLQWRNLMSKRAGRLTCPIVAWGRYNVRR
jgi:hypothetical protein